jgi:hypothetical protein
MVNKATRTINEKLCLMPRVALTEEAGIILARHLKSCKRKRLRRPLFSLTTGPWQSYDFSVGGLCDVFAYSYKQEACKN